MNEAQQTLVVAEDRAALSRDAAARFAEAAAEAIGAHGAFTVALSGGSTPRDLYRLLAERPWRDEIDWHRTLVFWGDERCVAPDHPESNFRLAREFLLDSVSIVASNIHRMRGELVDRPAAADSYAELLRRLLPASSVGVPSFDLMLLGLGSDSHTASLLPQSKLLREKDRLVAVTDLEREGTVRLTVTAPIIQHAERLLFLVSGADKGPALRAVLHGAADLQRHPAQLVRAARGEVVWLTDEAAAAGLSGDGVS